MPTVCDILRKFEHRIGGIDARLAAVEIRDCSGRGAFRGELWEVSDNQVAVWSVGTQKPLSWNQGNWARLRAGRIEARGNAFEFKSSDTGTRLVVDSSGLRLYNESGDYIEIDGVNSRVGTGNFAFGIRGWRINAVGDAEFNNIVARGALRTAVLAEETISCVGSWLLISPATSFTRDASSGSEYIYVKSNVFNVNDRIVVMGHNGIEWMIVLGVGVLQDEGDYKYNVSRGWGTLAVEHYKGEAVTSTGYYANDFRAWMELHGGMWRKPYLRIIEWTGADYTDREERVYLGWLNDVNDPTLNPFGWGLYCSNVFLKGKIVATAGELQTLSITDTLTLLGDGKIVTALSPNPRIEITASMVVGYSDADTKEFWLDAGTGKAYFAGGTASFGVDGILLEDTLAIEFTTDTLETKQGVVVWVWHNPIEASTGVVTGGSFRAVSHPDCAQSLSTLMGLHGSARHYGSGAVVGNLIGVYGIARPESGSGTVGRLIGLQAYPDMPANSGNVGEMLGLRILMAADEVSGTLSKASGIWIGGTPGKASERYGIWQDGTDDVNVFRGRLKITAGSPGAGKVLTSDANGLASWEAGGGAMEAHVMTGPFHTADGLTIGHVIRATGATTFAWAQLQHTDLGGVSADQHHAQLHATSHSAEGADALVGTIDGGIF